MLRHAAGNKGPLAHGNHTSPQKNRRIWKNFAARGGEDEEDSSSSKRDVLCVCRCVAMGIRCTGTAMINVS